MEFPAMENHSAASSESTKKPELTMAIDGTADIQKVTVIRNETNYQVFEPAAGIQQDLD